MVDWENVDIHRDFVRVLGQILAECGESGQCVMAEFGRLLQALGKAVEEDARSGYMEYRIARAAINAVETATKVVKMIILGNDHER